MFEKKSHIVDEDSGLLNVQCADLSLLSLEQWCPKLSMCVNAFNMLQIS